MEEEKAHNFGYEQVTATEKASRINQVFDDVSEQYDLMNDLMSFGLHRLWKQYAITCLDIKRGQSVLDLACGSADLSQLILRRTAGEVRLVCSDINERMLELGRNKIINCGWVKEVSFVRSSAEALPLNNNAVNRLVMGFGIRNVTSKSQALCEMQRVLAPGGKAVILEFSEMKHPFFAKLYDTYSFSVLPRIGRWVTGSEESYRYLVESIRVHPDQESLKDLMEQAGFDNVQFYNLLGGVVAVHVGFKG